MKIYVNIEASQYRWKNYLAEDFSGANALCRIATDAGKKFAVLWLPESIRDIRDGSKRGMFWARKLWHFGAVPESKAKHAAIRAWSKVSRIKD